MTAIAPPAASLAPVPPEIYEEEQRAIALREENLTRMALIDPTQVEAKLAARESALAKMRAVAIKSTHAFDWTLYKDKENRVVGVPRDSAAVQIRKWLGISIFNHRPISNGIPEPRVTVEKIQEADGVREVTVVEMWADGACNLTGETVESIYYAVRSDKGFTGSGTRQDLIASCRTGLDTKVTRILSGLRKVPEDVLVAAGIDVKKSHGGMGFGTSADRGAQRVAEAGVAEDAKGLWEEIMRRVGGSISDAKALCKDVTKGDKPGPDGRIFPGWDSIDRLTRDWQVKNAWKALRAHPVFGDQAASREPGAEG